jgi:hypothetical protein
VQGSPQKHRDQDPGLELDILLGEVIGRFFEQAIQQGPEFSFQDAPPVEIGFLLVNTLWARTRCHAMSYILLCKMLSSPGPRWWRCRSWPLRGSGDARRPTGAQVVGLPDGGASG